MGQRVISVQKWGEGWRKEGDETGRVGKKDPMWWGKLRQEAEKKDAFCLRAQMSREQETTLRGLNEWQLTTWPGYSLYLGKRVRQ